jgi:predicted anti-sigma-YlaC factor YlaD
MKNHVNQWLNAYHDGELRPRRRALVEAHLEECPQCQAELGKIQALSAMLAEDPLPETRTSPEHFAAQVALRLPRRETRRQNGSNFRWLWYAVPISMLLAIGFLRIITVVSEILVWGERLGINPNTTTWLTPGSTVSAQTSSGLLAQFSGLVLQWVNPFQSPLGLTLLLPLVFAICYMVWMLLWWVEHNQTQNTIEGEGRLTSVERS